MLEENTIKFQSVSNAITVKSFAMCFVSLRLLVAPLLLVIIGSMVVASARAQTFPIPPPFPENSPEKTKIAENDRTPPKIEILTTELHEGKNVFEVRIIDESSLQTREVKYVQNGQLKIVGLAKDQNDVYKALIDIYWPSRIVEVTAMDAAGNMARTYGEYEVTRSPDIFTQILNILSQIPRYFQNMFEAIQPYGAATSASPR